MRRNNNKINLPTNTTDIRTLAKYLKYINAEGIVSRDNEQEVFANVKIKESRKNVSNPAKDTHTKSTLKLFGLIDVFENGAFSVSNLGKEVINYYNDENAFSEEDRVALMLKVLCSWEINDNYGRHLHPGYILIKLLCDPDLKYYFTNHELSHFVMSPQFLKDNQYDEIKEYILKFRNQELPYDKNWKTSKSDIFLSTFDTNWGLLTRVSNKITLSDSEYNKLQSQWNEDPIEFDAESETSNEEGATDGKTIIVNECRLHALSAFISKIYISLIDGVKIRDYSSHFNSSTTQLVANGIVQKIYFGPPGTGKSHKVKELVAGKELRTERVTFHPEFDYNAFVGGYKPAMGIDESGKEIIRYEFVPQAFIKMYCEAWNSLGAGKVEDFYLIIEEINRGNCAEIFGDIFQLLDRNSDYDISPSKELKEFLLDKSKGLLKEEYGLEGGKLKLPKNFNILATMNTSDQSLFPMDSAFKRRWDWEYVPINYEENEENKSSLFKVVISETESFSWLSFIKEVNSIIKANDNLGMDKCLGNFFIKPESNKIEIETFINKAIFYLWNDVFKDEIEENNIFRDKTSYEDFFPIHSRGIEKVKDILNILNVKIIEEK